MRDQWACVSPLARSPPLTICCCCVCRSLQLWRDLIPASQQAAGYLSFRQSLGHAVFFADVIYSRREVEAQAVALDLLFVPASNAFSPFSEDVFVGYLFDDDRFARYANRNEGGAITLGADGAVAADWSWKLFGTYSRGRSETTVPIPDAAAMAQALASHDPGPPLLTSVSPCRAGMRAGRLVR